jgi:Ni/Co efflux regulator RcnB
MHTRNFSSILQRWAGLLALVLVITSSLPAMAKKPDGDDDSKSQKEDKKADKQREKEDKKEAKRDYKVGDVYVNRGNELRVGQYFGPPQRTVVYEYYGNPARSGRCPPGLAKKNNGCLPPGQAKKWGVGQSLPREVVYYAVPQPVVVQLGSPPVGTRYVRVDADVLLIAIGTNLVIDAILNFGRP